MLHPRYDLGKAAELKYGELAKLENELAKAEEDMEKQSTGAGAANRMLRDTVTVDDISGIVAKWTVSVWSSRSGCIRLRVSAECSSAPCAC
jgi:ATP-dependent Clp protease ATP-binding subunit ClpA